MTHQQESLHQLIQVYCFLPVALLVAFWFNIRSARKINIPLRAAAPHEIAHLQTSRVHEATRQIEELGFQYLGDLVSVREYGPAPPPPPDSEAPLAAIPSLPMNPVRFNGFIRILRHPTLPCHAEMLVKVSQSRYGVHTQAIISFDSVAGPGLNDWSYSTSNWRQLAANRLTRHPRRLTVRQPRFPLARLWEIHETRHHEVANAAGISWHSRYTLSDAVAYQDRGAAWVREVYSHLNPFSLTWRLLVLGFERSPEWQGELKGKLPPLPNVGT